MRESLAGKRVLIVRLSSLGDLILVLPTFKALRDRYPDAYIAWLVQDSLKELLEGTEGLDEIIPVRLLSVTDKYASPGRWFQGLRGLVQGLLETAKIFRQRGFEVVLEFQGLMKSALFAFLNRKASRYGFRNARELSPLLLNRPLFIRDKGRHAVDNYLQFAAHFGCPTAEVSFPLHIPKEAQDRMDRFLASHGLKEGEPLIFICATARWQSKFWHQEGFARVADELVERYGAKVLFSGLPAERAYLDGIRARMRHGAIVAAGLTGIKDFLALLRRCCLYVGVDSGAMHAARALGVPVVALFGPSDPRWIGPYGQRGGVVRVDVPCSPCNRRRCRQRTCMLEITPQMVLEEMERVIGRRSPLAEPRGA